MKWKKSAKNVRNICTEMTYIILSRINIFQVIMYFAVKCIFSLQETKDRKIPLIFVGFLFVCFCLIFCLAFTGTFFQI